MLRYLGSVQPQLLNLHQIEHEPWMDNRGGEHIVDAEYLEASGDWSKVDVGTGNSDNRGGYEEYHVHEADNSGWGSQFSVGLQNLWGKKKKQSEKESKPKPVEDEEPQIDNKGGEKVVHIGDLEASNEGATVNVGQGNIDNRGGYNEYKVEHHDNSGKGAVLNFGLQNLMVDNRHGQRNIGVGTVVNPGAKSTLNVGASSTDNREGQANIYMLEGYNMGKMGNMNIGTSPYFNNQGGEHNIHAGTLEASGHGSKTNVGSANMDNRGGQANTYIERAAATGAGSNLNIALQNLLVKNENGVRIVQVDEVDNTGDYAQANIGTSQVQGGDTHIILGTGRNSGNRSTFSLGQLQNLLVKNENGVRIVQVDEVDNTGDYAQANIGTSQVQGGDTHIILGTGRNSGNRSTFSLGQLQNLLVKNEGGVRVVQVDDIESTGDYAQAKIGTSEVQGGDTHIIMGTGHLGGNRGTFTLGQQLLI